MHIGLHSLGEPAAHLLLIVSFGSSIFNIAVAIRKNVQTIFICRYFGGFFGACPLTLAGAVFAEGLTNRQRGLAILLFSITVFSGPLLAPLTGGLIEMSYLGLRWTEYLVCIVGFTVFGLCLIFLEETYPPLSQQSRRSPEEDEELEHSCKAGGDRGRLARVGREES